MKMLFCYILFPLVFSRGDLFSSWVSDAWNAWDEKEKSASSQNTLVSAAQGHFEGPPILQAIRGGGGTYATFTEDANWPALTGIDLAIGIIVLGNDGDGGCGVVAFHGHPNCYEVMTTIEGRGGYLQILPDGTVQKSRVMVPGDSWIMEQGAQHYYRNLDPNGYWKFEIAFDCSEVAAVSSWKWIGGLNRQLVQQFWSGISNTAAQDLAMDADSRDTKSSTRFIKSCANDLATHQAVGDADEDAAWWKSGSTPTTRYPTNLDGSTGGTLRFWTYTVPGQNAARVPHTVGRFEMDINTIQNPAVVYNANTVYHVIQGEILIAMWGWDNTLSTETLNVHDLFIVPRASIYFIVNTGSEQAVILAHYDTPGSAVNALEYTPRIQVVTNFFAGIDARVLEPVLRCAQSSAEELAAASDDNPLFEPFTVGMDTLKSWADAVEDYCPLGCPHLNPTTTNPEATEDVLNIEVAWDEDSVPHTTHNFIWVFLTCSILFNIFLAVVLRFMMKHVGFELKNIWTPPPKPPASHVHSLPIIPAAVPDSQTKYGGSPQHNALDVRLPVPPDEAHWYYIQNDQQKGPVTEEALMGLLRTKKITQETYVWHDEKSDGWEPINQCKLLKKGKIPAHQFDDSFRM